MDQSTPCSKNTPGSVSTTLTVQVDWNMALALGKNIKDIGLLRKCPLFIRLRGYQLGKTRDVFSMLMIHGIASRYLPYMARLMITLRYASNSSESRYGRGPSLQVLRNAGSGHLASLITLLFGLGFSSRLGILDSGLRKKRSLFLRHAYRVSEKLRLVVQ